MSHFPDLSPYAYGRRNHPGVVHVGWLDGKHPFPKGSVLEHLIEKMKLLALNPTELYRGFHMCEICICPEEIRKNGSEAVWKWTEGRRSNGEIRVRLGRVTFAAPVLIIHYIEEHQYLPPADFLRAVDEARA